MIMESSIQVSMCLGRRQVWSFDWEPYWERHTNDRPGTNQSTVVPNKPMYVILNTAVQSGWPMQTNFSKNDVLHIVDWVRVWRKMM
jgi:hypothetical protein